jgi:hypothetical protein
MTRHSPAPPAAPRSTVAARLLGVLGAVGVLGLLAASAPVAARQQDSAERDARFQALMEGARLVGEFTVDTGQADAGPRPDLYSVSELEKGDGDVWIFHYTMSYGNAQGTTFDIPVRVVWAGDTPVLTMTEQAVEGLGTFTVRVMIHGDRYAGTWQHGAFGGHMWGRIERGDAGDADPAAGDGR